ncbi:hypothetical protein [Aliarcobacter cryaerophilus]|uniref:hypothetical protein n=1 Tax=Aliarcobacter cryaerophilus TaxID=28198 RepID=UPI00083327E7|nr:hypothetical protein [Aliarcobacter cryaerophilus]
MAFKDIKYFQELVISDIEEYKKNPTKFSEGRIRSIFSRAYYTIFLHCRDELNLEYNTELSVHHTVKKEILNSEINKIFHTHHQTRKEMDYNNINLDLKNTGKLLSELCSIKRDMNRILLLSKNDLLKK